MKAGLSLILFFGVLFVSPYAFAEDIDCQGCHPDQSAGKYIHNAILMGCPSCHSGVNAKGIPHKFTGAAKGLSSAQPDLCYGCHEKSGFYGPTVHAPVGIGDCSSCHDPHRSENEKLLITGKTELCFNCHDKKVFMKKVVHKPVETGECTECHQPHSSQNEALVYRKGNMLCRKCHPNALKQPHTISGFKRPGHPISGRKDPTRPGKTFECLSCHVPHATDWPRLYRFKGETPFDLCTNCHEF